MPACVWEPASVPPKNRLSISVPALHNDFFILAKMKMNAKTVTDHLSKLYECLAKTAGFFILVYFSGQYSAL